MVDESTARTFDLRRRERFLALVAVGKSIEQACAEAGTSRQTVNRWASLGRALGARADHREFAERFDAIRAELAEQREAVDAEPDPVCKDAAQVWAWVLAGDPLVGISPDELALLSAEQRAHALAVTAGAGRGR